MFTLIFLVIAVSGVVQGQTATSEILSSINKTEQQIVNQIDNVLQQTNNYVIEFLELIVKLVKAASEFVNDIQKGNSTGINISDLTAEIKKSFNSSSTKCTSEEEANIHMLITNTTNNILSCYSDISEDVQKLIPEIETLLNDIVDTIRNVTEDVNNCFKNNPMMFGLPGCILNEVNYIKEEYTNFENQLNITIATAVGTVGHFADDTKSCLSNIVSNFVAELGTTLTNFVECVYGSD